MNKHILGLLIGSVSLSAFAATSTIEVSAFYHEDAGFNASQEVVGFYRSLERMNTLMSAKGIDASFQPTYVGTITSSDMASTTTVFDGRTYMSGLSASVQSKTNVGDMAIGIFTQGSGVIGNSQVTTDATYVDEPNATRKAAIAGGYGLGRSGGYSATVFTIGHELFHAIGAAHDSTDAAVFNSYGTSRTDGFANTCANGYSSLMGSASVYTDVSNISIAGATDCTGSGDVVDFVNQYAAATASIAASRNNRTLTVSAVENANTQAFDVTVTRTSTGSAETIKLFIAGGYSDTGVGLTPVSLSFPASTASVTTSVLFDDVYPAFKAANGTENSTYAVAIGENEVSASAYDLLTVNTLWTASDDTSSTDGGDSGSGGGGSLGFIVLPILVLLGFARRKRII
ncbi:GlyGly-CTERM sorting domain-containing protein [Vibrio fluvialis]